MNVELSAAEIHGICSALSKQMESLADGEYKTVLKDVYLRLAARVTVNA